MVIKGVFSVKNQPVAYFFYHRFFCINITFFFVSVGGKLNIRYIAKELKPNETMQYNIYMCLAFLFDVNAYNSSAVFTKNYAALSILDDKLYGKYKVSATADFFTIENIGTSATVVSLVVLGR